MCRKTPCRPVGTDRVRILCLAAERAAVADQRGRQFALPSHPPAGCRPKETTHDALHPSGIVLARGVLCRIVAGGRWRSITRARDGGGDGREPRIAERGRNGVRTRAPGPRLCGRRRHPWAARRSGCARWRNRSRTRRGPVLATVPIPLAVSRAPPLPSPPPPPGTPPPAGDLPRTLASPDPAAPAARPRAGPARRAPGPSGPAHLNRSPAGRGPGRR